MKRILVVRLGHLGDVIHALPAVAALREARPDATIGWVIEERWTDLLFAPDARHAKAGSPAKPLIDDVHLLNSGAWSAAPLSARTWRGIRAGLGELRGASYDAALDFQGLWKSALLSRCSGADLLAGFRDPKERGAAILYNRRVVRARPHVVEQNLELVASLTGEPWRGVRFLLPRDAAAEASCEAELRRRGVEMFALISPGAGWGAKVWPARQYARVARGLADHGLTSLVNFGPGQQALAEAVVAASGGAAQTIGCSVGELVAVMRRARLYVGGDTGPTHLAAALSVPVVALFGPTDPARNGPYGTRALILRSPASRTSYAHVDRPDAGLASISSEEVLEAAHRLLEGERNPSVAAPTS